MWGKGATEIMGGCFVYFYHHRKTTMCAEKQIWKINFRLYENGRSTKIREGMEAKKKWVEWRWWQWQFIFPYTLHSKCTIIIYSLISFLAQFTFRMLKSLWVERKASNMIAVLQNDQMKQKNNNKTIYTTCTLYDALSRNRCAKNDTKTENDSLFV